MVRILVDKIPDPIPHISQHIPLALLFVNLVLTGSARSQDSHSNIDSLSNIKLVSTQIIRNVTKHCPESGAWSLGYKGDRLSQSGRSIGQFSQSQDGGEDMSHVGLMNTKEKRQTWLQAIYKCPLCLVSGCLVHRLWLVHFSHSPSDWLRRCIVIAVTLSLTWDLWYNRVTDILSLESLGTNLFTHSI